jgi:PIN domain
LLRFLLDKRLAGIYIYVIYQEIEMGKKESFKTYVLDTTILIEDPDIFYKIAGEVVVPFVVLRELDGLKNSDHVHITRAARKVARTLDRLGSYNDLTEGVRLPTGTILKIVNAFDPVDALASDADNRIVGTALMLQRQGTLDIVLASTDNDMRIAAKVLGLKAEYWPDFAGKDQLTVKERMESVTVRDGHPLKPERPKIVIALMLGTILPIVTAMFLGSNYIISERVLNLIGCLSIPFGATLLIGAFSGLFGGEGSVSFGGYKPIGKIRDSSSASADLTKDGTFNL